MEERESKQQYLERLERDLLEVLSMYAIPNDKLSKIAEGKRQAFEIVLKHVRSEMPQQEVTKDKFS